MIVPEFLRFYTGYNLRTLLDEFAVSFFALVNQMYSLQGSDRLNLMATINGSISGNDKYADELRKQANGIAGIVREVKVATNGR